MTAQATRPGAISSAGEAEAAAEGGGQGGRVAGDRGHVRVRADQPLLAGARAERAAQRVVHRDRGDALPAGTGPISAGRAAARPNPTRPTAARPTAARPTAARPTAARLTAARPTGADGAERD